MLLIHFPLLAGNLVCSDPVSPIESQMLTGAGKDDDIDWRDMDREERRFKLPLLVVSSDWAEVLTILVLSYNLTVFCLWVWVRLVLKL